MSRVRQAQTSRQKARNQKRIAQAHTISFFVEFKNTRAVFKERKEKKNGYHGVAVA